MNKDVLYGMGIWLVLVTILIFIFKAITDHTLIVDIIMSILTVYVFVKVIELYVND